MGTTLLKMLRAPRIIIIITVVIIIINFFFSPTKFREKKEVSS
jgi:hypothetical protein